MVEHENLNDLATSSTFAYSHTLRHCMPCALLIGEEITHSLSLRPVGRERCRVLKTSNACMNKLIGTLKAYLGSRDKACQGLVSRKILREFVSSMDRPLDHFGKRCWMKMVVIESGVCHTARVRSCVIGRPLPLTKSETATPSLIFFVDQEF